LEDVCFSLQEIAFSMLTEITERALAHTNKPEVMLVGGVAANNRLREMLKIMSEEQNVDFHVPEKQFCGDNGAMIAWLGILQYINGKRMKLEETRIIPNYRTDMVEVNWIKGEVGKKRKILPHLIGKGAEADIKKSIYLDWDVVIKERIKKGYRIEELDKLIRTRRTVREGRFLSSIKNFGIPAPYVFDVDKDKGTIVMSYIHGKLAKDVIEEGGLDCCYDIGKIIAKLHENNIIHNDLTTSNFIVDGKRTYIIDFGLGKFSDLIEDKAIDLIVLKKAILTTHYNKFKEVWEKIIEGYKTYKQWEEVINYMGEVEKRARYI